MGDDECPLCGTHIGYCTCRAGVRSHADDAARHTQRLRQLVARNPAADAQLLARLAFYAEGGGEEDVILREAVASNPNCDSQLLIDLSEMKRADFFYESSFAVRCEIASHARCPPMLKARIVEEMYAGQVSGQDWFDENAPSVPPELLERLFKDRIRPEYLFLVLARSESTPPGILRKIFAEDSEFASEIAENRSAPPDVLSAIYSVSDSAITVCSLAENPATPVVVLESIHRSMNHNRFATYLLRNPRTPAAILEDIFDITNDYQRSHLAENPSITEAQIAALLELNDHYMRWLFENPAIGDQSSDVAMLFRKASERRSVEALCANRRLSTEAIEWIWAAHGKEGDARKGLAANSSTPLPVLSVLFGKNDGEFSWALAGNGALNPSQLAELAHV